MAWELNSKVLFENICYWVLWQILDLRIEAPLQPNWILINARKLDHYFLSPDRLNKFPFFHCKSGEELGDQTSLDIIPNNQVREINDLTFS